MRFDKLQRLERSHSGLVRLLGKQVYSQGYREFESPSLRLRLAEALAKLGFIGFKRTQSATFPLDSYKTFVIG